MNLFNIFKEDERIKFIVDSPFVPNKFDRLKNFNPKESTLQIVKNDKQTYHIIYSYTFSGVNGSRCMDFYKITLQDILSKGEILDFLFLNSVVVPALKQAAKRCFSLRLVDGVAFSPVNVFIFNETEGFSITANYYIEEITNIDSDSLHLEAIREAQNLNFEDYTNKLISIDNKMDFGFSYPFILGQSDSDLLLLIDADGATKEIKKEDFICLW